MPDVAPEQQQDTSDQQLDTSDLVDEVVDGGSLTMLFQPVVRLDDGEVVGWEALARGPEGSPLHMPVDLFAAARAAGRVADLDRLCRSRAVEAALSTGIAPGRWLAVNVEADALDDAWLDDSPLVGAAAADLDVVVEVGARALVDDPAALLRLVADVRARGLRVAVHDVGADPAALAMLPLVRPDVVKLDLGLLRRRPAVEVARVVTAVNAEAERSGALVLAVGIETDEHLDVALSLGAVVGQGWRSGRPGPLPAPTDAPPRRPVALPVHVAPEPATTPFGAAGQEDRLRPGRRDVLVGLGRHLEAEALDLGASGMVLAAFPHAEDFGHATRRRFEELGRRCGVVVALGDGIPAVPAAGVRGAAPAADDPIRGELAVAVLGPHVAAALVARPRSGDGVDDEAGFDHLVTYDREAVLRVAAQLLERVPSGAASVSSGTGPVPTDADDVVGGTGDSSALAGTGLQELALAASTHGIVISDMRVPHQPLIYVNRAFEKMTGFVAGDVLGRNCRFLQGEATDPAASQALGDIVRAGREGRVRLRNHRRDGSVFWNEVRLSPVHDDEGRLTHYIGLQHDVTEAVEAVERMAWLTDHDHVTGLRNRSALGDPVDVGGDDATVLFIDLDGFKQVAATHGREVGDELLRTVGERLRAVVADDDVLVHLGGDEFAVVMRGEGSQRVGERLAASVKDTVEEPIAVAGETLHVWVSVGLATGAGDAEVGELLRRADVAAYRSRVDAHDVDGVAPVADAVAAEVTSGIP